MADIVKFMQKQPDFYAMKGASEEDIKMAEQVLELRFATEYRKYIAAFGVASFAGHELPGSGHSPACSRVGRYAVQRQNLHP